MAEIDVIGVPFDGYGRIGNQARAAELLAVLGPRDEAWRRQSNVGTYRKGG